MSENFEIKTEDAGVLFCGHNSNFKNVLHIEGQSNRVYIHQRERGSMSMDVYHGQTFEIDLPNVCKVAEIVAHVELYREEIQEALDSYTERWNSANWIGSFDDEKTLSVKHEFDAEDFGFEYVYETPDEFVNQAWTFLHDFAEEYPKPKNNNFAQLAEEILEGNCSDTYCDFQPCELADYLKENHEEIWED